MTSLASARPALRCRPVTRPRAPAVSAPSRPTRTTNTRARAIVLSMMVNPASLRRRRSPMCRVIGLLRVALERAAFAKRPLHSSGAMDERLYFRQLLTGRDLARTDPVARQMLNFVYLIGDRETGEAVAVDPAHAPREVIDTLAADR